MSDAVLGQVIIGVVGSGLSFAGSVLFILLVQRQEAKAKALEAKARVDQATEDAEAKRRAATVETARLEREITERVLASSNAQLERQERRIEALESKLQKRDGEIAVMQQTMEGQQDQIDRLTAMVRTLIEQVEAAGLSPAIDVAAFKDIEAMNR